MDEKYPNAIARDRLEELVAVKKDTMKVNHRDQMCIIFRHDDFPGDLLYCVERYCHTATEGLEADIFDPTQAIVPIAEIVGYG